MYSISHSLSLTKNADAENQVDSLTEFFLVCCIMGWSANCTALLPLPELNIPEAPVRRMVQKWEAEAAAAAASAAAAA